MSEPIVIELDWIPPAEVRGNSRAHWAKRYRVTDSMRMSGEVRTRAIRPMDASRLRVTFNFKHWRKIDLDNLAIGMKAFIDGMFRDDDPDHVVYGAHTFTKCPKGESRTVVTIEELT